MRQYQCYRIWAWETATERIADNLLWYPTAITMPVASLTKRAIVAARDLTSAICNPSPTIPLSPAADNKQTALEQLVLF